MINCRGKEKKMRRKYKVESVNVPEGLRIIEGWEIRKVHTGNHPGIVMQNPDSGEICKLIISGCCFEGSHIKLSREI